MSYPSSDTSLRVRVLLALSRCTATEISRGAGIAPETFSRIVSGRQAASIDLLTRLEAALLDRARAAVEAERQAQGLPAYVTDPAALRAIGGLVRAGK